MPISERQMRRVLTAAIALIFIASFFGFGRWKDELDGGDSLGYYLHLPAALLYHDVGNFEKTLTAAAGQQIGRVPGPGETWSPTETAPDGRRYIRWPVGVAVLTAPFFALAHLYCLLSGQYPADGFSIPYILMAGLAPLCYVVLGFWLLFGVLRRFFTLQITVLTLATLALATNLFYFAAFHNYMAHGFLFLLIAWLIERSLRFWDAPSARGAVWIGVAVGLIALTRLHDLVVALIPLLWGVDSWRSARERAAFLARRWRWLLLAAGAGLLCLFPQALYYKTVSGHWWWYAYGNEQLDLLHPHILGGWFDFKNGWLIYTPVMALALVGIFWLRRFARPALAPLLTVLPLHVYIAYSWWCWYYTNGFGSRPMVDLYPLLAFPLAAFLQVGWQGWGKKIVLAALLLFFSWLNIFQVWQFHSGLFLSEYETPAHYWAMFGQTKSSPATLIAWDANERQPTEPPIFIRRLGEDGLEDSIGPHFVRDPRHGGAFAAFLGEQEFGGLVRTAPGEMRDARPGDWVRVSIWAYVPGKTKCFDQFGMAGLSTTFHDAAGNRLRNRTTRIATKIGNPEGSIWNTGATDRWGEAALFVRVPSNFPPHGTVNVYVSNPRREAIFIDDLRVELWRKR